MHMTSSNWRLFADRLDNFRKQRGMSQGDLARLLGVSQPHISRVLSADVPPGDKLRSRAMKILAAQQEAPENPEWLEKVAAAAGKSEAFRRLLAEALTLVDRASVQPSRGKSSRGRARDR